MSLAINYYPSYLCCACLPLHQLWAIRDGACCACSALASAVGHVSVRFIKEAESPLVIVSGAPTVSTIPLPFFVTLMHACNCMSSCLKLRADVWNSALLVSSIHCTCLQQLWYPLASAAWSGTNSCCSKQTCAIALHFFSSAQLHKIIGESSALC